MDLSLHADDDGASAASPGPVSDEPLGWPPGWSVRIVEETGSTNDDLAAEADSLPDRSVLATRHQTAGRGRLDRKWDAPPGTNLLVSFFFRPAADSADLVRRIALALVHASREVGGVDVGLKWPNDVLLGDRKMAGILAQQVTTPTGTAVIVGCGCNVGWAPDGAARLGDVAPERVLEAMLRAFDELDADVTDTYRRALVTLGQRVRVETSDGEMVGRAVDVETDGRLIVIDECAVTHRLHVGDVVHLRAD